MNRHLLQCLIAAILFNILSSNASLAAVANQSPQDLVRTDIASGHETTCALRDKYGYLWVGTALGLKCYDGNGVSVYDNNFNALLPMSNLTITSLAEFGDDIYIGANTGLYVFDRSENRVNKFKVHTRWGVEISSQVEKLALVGHKYLWVCTEGQGLFVYDDSNNSLLQSSRYASFYSDLAIGHNGLVYVSSLQGEIQVFEPKGKYLKTIKIPEYTIQKNTILMAVSNSDIWISTGVSLYKLDVTTDVIASIGANNHNDNINAMLARPDGTILMGATSGLWSYNTITNAIRPVMTISNASEEYDVRVLGLVNEPSGDVIIIHPSGPIDIYSTQTSSMSFYPLPDLQTSQYNQIYAMQQSSNSDGFWVGTEKGLFYYEFTASGFAGRRVPDFKDMAISAILVLEDKLLVGTKLHGVIVYDTVNKKQLQKYTFDEKKPYSIITNKINSIYRANDGTAYYLTDWGICYYNLSGNNFLPLTEFSQHTRATSMQEDKNGGQWIATLNNGLYYRKNSADKFTKADWCKNIVSLPIVTLYNDSLGRLWAATKNQGLFIYNEQANDFLPVNIPMGAENPISFIVEDSEKRIWAGVNNMLVEIDSALKSRIYNFVHHPDVMPSFNITAQNRDLLVIGSRNGFYTLDPTKVYTYESRVKVLPKAISFPNINIDEKSTDKYDLNSLLYTRSNIKLPFEYNTFSISLSSIHPNTEPNLQFDYYLAGLDKAWRTSNYNNEISYSNVAFGDYRLLMKPHGVEGAATTELAITILPPWYLTIWALVVYAIIVILLCFSAFIVVRSMLRKNFQRRINELRLQKERELFEAKTRYFVDLVHEIRTPLMLISLPLEQLTEAMKADVHKVSESRNMEYIRSMQHNIDYLLSITNQLLDFRKVENTSEVRLCKTRYNVSASLRKICQRFEEPLSIENIKIDIQIPEEDILIAADGDKIERILMNLVGNAMKYAERKIALTLSLEADDKVKILVGDDGRGISESERDKIFDAYYQIAKDDVAASLGTGLGLAYSKLVTEAHNGTITAGTSEYGGALLTIVLPIGEVPVSDISEVLTEGESFIIPESDVLLKQDKTVLLVEDNKELRDMISAALRNYCKVLTAVDGVKALEVLAANNVDVIVSDVMMPRMDGIELCRKVKSDVYYSQILFLILTAKTGAEAHEVGMKSGADVYLEKPFSIKQLIYQINNLLSTRQHFYDLIRNNMTTNVPSSTESKPILNRMDADFLKRMNDYISESIRNEDFSIDTLADKMNMSRSSFYRKITMVVGMSPSEYLKNFRLARAAELLIDGCRISEVSERVGFASSSYFAKCFKEKFGVLPSEYVGSLPTSNASDADVE